MKKKILFALLLIIALFSTTGCGVGLAFTGCDQMFNSCNLSVEGTYKLTSYYDGEYVYKDTSLYDMVGGFVTLELKNNNEAMFYVDDLGYKLTWEQHGDLIKIFEDGYEWAEFILEGNTLVLKDEYNHFIFTKQ